MTDDDRYKLWLTNGLRFGYPECCIAAFLQLDHLVEPLPDKPNVFDGTGFIPCRKCRELPMMTMLGRIHKAREQSLPAFPKG